MFKYLLRKLFYGLLVMLGVITLVFFLFQGFGDPARLVIGQRADQATQENIRKELALDRPVWKQFLHYLNDVSPLSYYPASEYDTKKISGIYLGEESRIVLKFPYLRRSYQTRKDVWQELIEALPGTIILAFAAMLFATIIGIILGVIAAVNKGNWMDTTTVFSAVLGISAPSFLLGSLLPICSDSLQAIIPGCI